jgi:hypothetical protein
MSEWRESLKTQCVEREEQLRAAWNELTDVHALLFNGDKPEPLIPIDMDIDTDRTIGLDAPGKGGNCLNFDKFIIDGKLNLVPELNRLAIRAIAKKLEDDTNFKQPRPSTLKTQFGKWKLEYPPYMRLCIWPDKGE